MAHNPQAPYGQGQNPQGQGPEGYDPAGNTQMFRAFVDEGAPQQRQPQAAATSSGGPKVGLIVGVVAVIVVLAAVAWLALG
ncbi:hypothetical protein [Streptomyces zaomyceticus]|uniref:Uncharacterized protein n=1 Tax=Streptomyces zaomyceticus TaxID=68286 RepID=A0ABZ1LBR2_9ACTN|nr:hypothetical protein [Streptomyces zaomyceticus]WSQ20040.1 hypothetical protein OG237_22810 [Streptomyces zaomyceticus]GHG38970.1 hypothetical protein GCM10018791_66080 [Streptomyces zaomyceticus]